MMRLIGGDGMSTHKYKDTIHVIFQGIDPSAVMALGFISERVQSALELPSKSPIMRVLQVLFRYGSEVVFKSQLAVMIL